MKNFTVNDCIEAMKRCIARAGKATDNTMKDYHTAAANELATHLHDYFNLDWDAIEAIELDACCSI